MEGSADDLGAPESWEVADLDESMNRLKLTLSSDNDSKPRREPSLEDDDDNTPPLPPPPPPQPPSSSSSGEKVSDDIISQVDQFLRDAIQNPRERLSILRMEQDVEKFIRDPNQQQLEFQQLPTSYLRLAAHRVAQHYSLQSMVLMDNSLPDGSGSRIIVRKTSECKPPLIRLADIPVKLSSEDNVVMKVAIKQRPQKQAQLLCNVNSNSMKNSSSKSVEERKEEYNRARARIFSCSSVGTVGVKSECEPRKQDNPLRGSLGISRVEEKPVSAPDVSSSRGLVESSANNSRPRSRTEKEPVGRYRQSNRVAIFRDREVERKDPDYDRSYERYMQRFDPGFGFNGGSYPMQPMYTPVVNYNTEFPQLGSSHGPQLSSEHHSRPLLQHIPGPWAPPSTPSGMGYGHPDTMMPTFNPSQAGGHSSPSLYLHSSQYSCQRPIPYIHHEPVHQPFAQSHQLPPDASFGLARPR